MIPVEIPTRLVTEDISRGINFEDIRGSTGVADDPGLTLGRPALLI
jgi:hypothetical protein